MTFSVPIEKKVKRIDKDREEIAKKHLTDYNLWQAHYQILLIIWLKEYIKIKCNYGHDDK